MHTRIYNAAASQTQPLGRACSLAVTSLAVLVLTVLIITPVLHIIVREFHYFIICFLNSYVCQLSMVKLYDIGLPYILNY